MAYATPADIRDYMKQLPQRVTDADLQVFVDQAEAYIDGALGSVYVVPFVDPAPKMIKAIAKDLAIFFTYEALYSSNAPNLDEYQKMRYERAMSLLGKLTDGKISLPGIPPIDAGTSSGLASTTDDMENIFSYEDPEW